MDGKWLHRGLTVSQMKEYLAFLGNKWLMKIKNLTTPPKMKECTGWEKQDPREIYIPELHSKIYEKGNYKGVSFPVIHARGSKGEKQGVINLQLNFVPPHLTGVVVAQQYSMKQAKELI